MRPNARPSPARTLPICDVVMSISISVVVLGCRGAESGRVTFMPWITGWGPREFRYSDYGTSPDLTSAVDHDTAFCPQRFAGGFARSNMRRSAGRWHGTVLASIWFRGHRGRHHAPVRGRRTVPPKKDPRTLLSQCHLFSWCVCLRLSNWFGPWEPDS